MATVIAINILIKIMDELNELFGIEADEFQKKAKVSYATHPMLHTLRAAHSLICNSKLARHSELNQPRGTLGQPCLVSASF